MPYLNWKDQTGLKQEIAGGPGGAGPLRLTLGLDSAQASMLLPLLRDVLSEEAPLGSELRVDLPRNWIVFWKKREGESRLLIAHPQTDEWVATAALSAAHGQLLLERFERLSSGEALSVGELEATGGAT